MSVTVRLLGPTQKDYAKQQIDAAPTDFVMKLGKETRTDIQNRKLWPMIADIRRDVPDMARFNADDAKLRFLNALGTEMRFLPTLENEGMFPVGLRSSTLTVAQFSGLVEMLYKYGAEQCVRWTERRAA